MVSGWGCHVVSGVSYGSRLGVSYGFRGVMWFQGCHMVSGWGVIWFQGCHMVSGWGCHMVSGVSYGFTLETI